MDLIVQPSLVRQWVADIELRFESDGRRTFVRRRHCGPLSIQRPFYPAPGECHVYLLHPPGGVVAGDRLNVSISAGTGSQALITTPAATKFYRSVGSVAEVTQTIECQASMLEWLPMENIYFEDADVRSATTIHLDNRSRWCSWEIHCFGRTAAREAFLGGRLDSRLSVDLDGTPLLRERLLVCPGRLLQRKTGAAGASVLGTMLLYPVQADAAALLRSTMGGVPGASMTRLDNLLLIRYRGARGDVCRKLFVDCWAALRQRVVGAPAVRPRIWST